MSRMHLQPGLRRGIVILAAAVAGLVSGPAPLGAQDLLSEGQPVKVRAKAIDSFHIGHDTKRFGQLTFLGGLELIASDRKIGGLSGLLSLDNGNRFLAVTDNGHWVSGTIDQSEDSKPLGISDVRYSHLRGSDGKTLRARWGHDTEALALSPSGLYVTAETKNAIYRFPWPISGGQERMIGELSLPEDIRALPRNAGLEALASGPENGPLAGKLIAISETAKSDAHGFAGYIVGPEGTSSFTINRHDRFDATDAAFLPDGDLILMERRFNLRDLIGMRLRRFAGADIKSGAVLEGEVLLEADFDYQIDNMEALAIHQNTAGETILTLLSDNNRSILQRTVFLRFRLED